MWPHILNISLIVLSLVNGANQVINRQKIMCVIVAVVAALLAVNFFGRQTFRVEAFQFVAAVEVLDYGMTELNMPPIGSLRAKTHAGPLRLKITLQNVDVDALKQMYKEKTNREELLDRAETQLKKTIPHFVGRLVMVVILGSVIGIWAVFRLRRPADYLPGIGASLLVLVSLLTLTFYTYDHRRFANPQFEGALRGAPWMIGMVQEAMLKVDRLGEQMVVTAENLYNLFERIDNTVPDGPLPGDIRILHVSDIHDNPAAMRFVDKVVDEFSVDLIVDTGDLTNFGLPLEAFIVEEIKRFSVPYLFVGGNHDSANTAGEVAKIPNARVLKEGEVLELKGLQIMGYPDPQAKTDFATPPTSDQLIEMQETIEASLAQMPRQPDILLVHNDLLASRLAGKVPMIMFGHNHVYGITEKNGTRLIDAGTTGAAGVQGLQTSKEIPYTAVLVYFRQGKDQPTPVAADVLRVWSLKGGFGLERTMFEQ